MFRAILLEQVESAFRASLQQLEDATLDGQEGDVLVRVEYSTLNYKDALAITNRSPVVRKWPMVAGIDFAGVVESSAHPQWQAGDRVVSNGWGAGEVHWGGLAERAKVPGDWLVRLPEAITTRQAAAIGTAGYTAMLCVMMLERHGLAPGGEVLVTGAAGGVGSVAVALLSALGHRVVASTGRPQEAEYLKALGAAELIERSVLATAGRALQKERWNGVVDVVGSTTLANACAQTRYRGVVAACGLAGAMDFPASVAPFILRGVKLIGVDSVMCPSDDRRTAWERLATELGPTLLERMAAEISLADALEWAPRLLDGAVRGRLVVALAR